MNKRNSYAFYRLSNSCANSNLRENARVIQHPSMTWDFMLSLSYYTYMLNSLTTPRYTLFSSPCHIILNIPHDTRAMRPRSDGGQSTDTPDCVPKTCRYSETPYCYLTDIQTSWPSGRHRTLYSFVRNICVTWMNTDECFACILSYTFWPVDMNISSIQLSDTKLRDICTGTVQPNNQSGSEKKTATAFILYLTTKRCCIMMSYLRAIHNHVHCLHTAFPVTYSTDSHPLT